MGTAIALAMVLGALLGTARDARADGGIDQTALLESVGFLGADLTFTTIDVVRAVQGQWPSRIYGGVELVITGTQLALSGVALARTPSGDTDSLRSLKIYLGWAGVLALHGLVTLVRPDQSAQTATAMSRRPRSWDVGITLARPGAGDTKPALFFGGVF